jgi:hypothetical protein
MKRTVLRVEELEQRDVPSAIEIAPVLLAPLSSGGVTNPAVATASTLNAATVGSPACPAGWGINALGSPANPFNALGSPASPLNALGSPASPLNALGSPASEVARSLNAGCPLGAPLGQLAAPAAPLAPVNGVAMHVVGALSNPLASAPTCLGEAVQTIGIGATDLNVSNLDHLFIAAPGNPAHGVMAPAAATMPALGTLASGVL